MTETWDKLPLGVMDELARLESYNRYHYRPVYSMHKWWARRPGSTFRILGLSALTDESTSRDDILSQNSSETRYQGKYLKGLDEDYTDVTVLDPFTGGGTTLVEMNRLGAQTIGYELNPVAWWIVKKTIEDVDVQAFEQAASDVLSDVRDELGDLYTTIDPETGNEVEVLYTFQSQTLPCLTCDEQVNLFKNYKLRSPMKTVPGAVYCPNDDCEDRIIELEDIGDTVECPSCNTVFDPNDGNASGSKYTCSNGHKHDIKETLERTDQKPEFDYYAIQYLARDGSKKIKSFDEHDAQIAEKATKRLESEYEQLPIPTQKIPPGDKPSRLTTRGYERYDDLFTDRHLLTYGKLFQRATEISDTKIAELVITAISNSLERGSQLIKWDTYDNRSDHVFVRQSYIPRVEPVETNPLNTNENVAAVENFIERVTKAKRYCQEPFEKLKEDGTVNKYSINGESVSEERLVGLNCKTSERLDEEDGSVDYVITDPPYFDNVQYSELSDYFYVWLHEVLGDRYEEFEPDHVPSAREIVANSRTGKDEEFFIDSLTNVFSECYRVLDNDGELIFTYHHNENEAWSVILEALIESGFTVTAAYPVQSEMGNSITIRELENAEYDILIYANKEQSEEEITLTELRQNLFFELQDMAAKEQDRHGNLSKADLGVILRGKCMYYYSRHYPNVYSDGEQVGIDEALDTVDGIIEQVLESSVNLPQGLDPITRSYAAFYQRGSEEADELNKHLLAKNLNVSDLESERLVKGPRENKEPVTADERITFIEGKLNKNGKGGDELLDVDKVQYLYHLYKTDQNTVEYLKEWKTEELEELANFMADVTGDERYENVMDMGITQF